MPRDDNSIQRELNADRPDRRAWGTPDRDGRVRTLFGVRVRAAFRPLLRDAPTGAMTRETAAGYAREIDAVLDLPDWTRSERQYLYGLRKRWQRRADGEDPRFNALGGVFGGATDRTRGLTPSECAGRIMKLLNKSGAARESQSERVARILKG